MWRVALVFVLWLAQTPMARPAVPPIPEAEQAARALELINAYHAPRPASVSRKLHIVYFTPSSRAPEPRYRERLEPILEDIRAFYRDGMSRSGFGPKTFDLARDADGKLIIHLVQGKEPEAAYTRSGFQQDQESDVSTRNRIKAECRPAIEAAGISFEHETVLIFCNLATWNEKAKTFVQHSPYCGFSTQTNGVCFALDTIIQNLEELPRKEPIWNDDQYGDMSLGKFNTIFIGGIAHELGHASALPHCGERWDEKPRGTSLMGIGNHTYRDERRGESKGSFLTMASALFLAAHPLFNGSDKGEAAPGQLQQCDLLLSTNLTGADLARRRGARHLEGTVKGSPSLYGVVACFDSVHDGCYSAPTATSVPDSRGRFTIEISDLAACEKGAVWVVFCHVNGAVTERHLGFSVNRDGGVDLGPWELRQALEPVAGAVAANDLNAAQNALRELEKTNAPASAKASARELLGTLKPDPKSIPAEVPASFIELSLGQCQAGAC